MHINNYLHSRYFLIICTLNLWSEIALAILGTPFVLIQEQLTQSHAFKNLLLMLFVGSLGLMCYVCPIYSNELYCARKECKLPAAKEVCVTIVGKYFLALFHPWVLGIIST